MTGPLCYMAPDDITTTFGIHIIEKATNAIPLQWLLNDFFNTIPDESIM